jgi:hypothetical protein
MSSVRRLGLPEFSGVVVWSSSVVRFAPICTLSYRRMPSCCAWTNSRRRTGVGPHHTPTLPMQIGIPERQTHGRVCNGTTTLFAALGVATGKVIGTC